MTITDSDYREGEKPAAPSQAAEDNVALLRRIWDPIERGESQDVEPFFDALADDVVFTLSVGELHGKQAVIAYFAKASALLEFNPFVVPVQYFGDGDRALMLGEEAFTLKKTGATHHAAWVWVHDFQDGSITRILSVQDLSPIADDIRAVLASAQDG